MGTRRCINCMEHIDDSTAFCPKCGYGQEEGRSPLSMKLDTILRGRYLVGRVLGQGGFGITYVAYDLVLDIKVAIKEYFPMGLASRNHTISNQIQWSTTQFSREQWQQGCENFLKEARRMAKLDSLPGIVRVRDTFPENQTSYIVMDFVEGETLKQRLIKTGTMRTQDCIALLAPLMQSLGKMHQKGLIHRDISPDNIMIGLDGSACLIDFGAAKDVSYQQNAASRQVTKKGFSPPEQYREKGSIGSWTDVYALCATIYYCVMGKTVPDAMDRMYEDTLTFDDPIQEPWNDTVVKALKDGLKLRSEERIQSVKELLSRLMKTEPDDVIRDAADDDSGIEDGKKHGINLNVTGNSKVTIKKKNEKKNEKKKKKFSKKKLVIAAVVIITFFALFSDDDDKDKKVTNDVKLAAETVSESAADTENTETRLSIEHLGVPNANVSNYGGYIMIPRQHLYYIAADNKLFHCTYDEEKQTFYMNDVEKISDYGAYMTMDDNNHVYFVTTDYRTPSIMRIDYDGGNMTQLYVSEEGKKFNYMQYARFSDQSEYLYFVLENEQSSDIPFTSLYRFDLNTEKMEVVIEGDLWWYNLCQDGIYYTEVTLSSGFSSTLMKADLDGQNAQVLDADKDFLGGFVEGDLLYLYSSKEETVLVCNPDGMQNSEFGGFYDCDIDFNNNFGCGDGWLYYTGRDGNIHRIRTNGSGDEVIVEGHTAVQICYFNSGLWFVESESTGRDHQYRTQVYYAYKTGETTFELMEPDINWAMNTAYLQNFEYTESEDGKGIVITKYVGNAAQFEMPDEIDGKPVVSIGESAFAGSSVQKVGLPDGLLTIGEKAFFGCEDLTFIGLPDGLVEIGDSAFGTCISLEEIDFPESLTTIGNFTFAETYLSEVYIPSNVEKIGAGAFALYSTSQLTEFTVSEENKTYTEKEGVLFSGDGKTLMAFPAGMEGLYIVPEGTAEIEAYAFGHCTQLTDVTIPRSVKVIGVNAFFDTNLSEITISSDCQLLGDLGGSVTANYY